MYLVKTPYFTKLLFPEFIWKIDTSEKVVFLTFDDGPIPEVTPWVLDELKQVGFKVTFFCVGDNVLKHPDIYQQILEEGHSVGNHTFNHLNGWTSGDLDYIENVKLCDDFVKTSLFRPPYGRVKKSQSRIIKSDKKIIMWDILSGDFDLHIDKNKCLNNVIKNYRPGSIIVFHDSLKSEKTLRYVLPKVINHLKNNGFASQGLSDVEYLHRPLK